MEMNDGRDIVNWYNWFMSPLALSSMSCLYYVYNITNELCHYSVMLKYFKNFAIWRLRQVTVAWYHSFVMNLIRYVIIFHVIILSCAHFVMSPFCHLSYFCPLNSNPPNIALIGLIVSLSSKWYKYKTLHSISDFQLSFNLFCFFQACISVCYLCLHFGL